MACTKDKTVRAPAKRLPNHTHACVIPVAWRYLTAQTSEGWRYIGIEVTKLRCSCGEEVDR
jgi:hypothetical protein